MIERCLMPSGGDSREHLEIAITEIKRLLRTLGSARYACALRQEIQLFVERSRCDVERPTLRLHPAEPRAADRSTRPAARSM